LKIHLIDGTFDLFRVYYAMPSLTSPDGTEVGAVRGIVKTISKLLLEEEVTHVACAFDHVITSFRNDLYDGYKAGNGVPRELLNQFDLAEEIVSYLGVVVWPMIDFEADDAIGSAVEKWHNHPEVEQIVVCSADKDFNQLVRGNRVVIFDRIRGILRNEISVEERFGIPPSLMPDYLALVGDSADGIPGIPHWGSKSASKVLSYYGKLENIPREAAQWQIKVRGSKLLSKTLNQNIENAVLFKKLASLKLDVPLRESLEDLQWRGVKEKELRSFCDQMGFSEKFTTSLIRTSIDGGE